MALTLAQRNLLRKRAAQEAAAAAPAALMTGATGYEVQMAKMQQDQLRLSNLQSTEAKAQLKAELLPEYEPYIAGVLESGKGAQDDVIVTVMLWRFDAGDIAGGLKVAGYVLEHKLKMPDRFNRTTGCVVAEEVAEMALKKLRAGESFDLQLLLWTKKLTSDEDMPDQARAKLFLAIGRTFAAKFPKDAPEGTRTKDLIAAKWHLNRAIELFAGCGGKTDLANVERLIKKYAGLAS